MRGHAVAGFSGPSFRPTLVLILAAVVNANDERVVSGIVALIPLACTYMHACACTAGVKCHRGHICIDLGTEAHPRHCNYVPKKEGAGASIVVATELFAFPSRS